MRSGFDSSEPPILLLILQKLPAPDMMSEWHND
jgi:hypothetical protein